MLMQVAFTLVFCLAISCSSPAYNLGCIPKPTRDFSDQTVQRSGWKKCKSLGLRGGGGGETPIISKDTDLSIHHENPSDTTYVSPKPKSGGQVDGAMSGSEQDTVTGGTEGKSASYPVASKSSLEAVFILAGPIAISTPSAPKSVSTPSAPEPVSTSTLAVPKAVSTSTPADTKAVFTLADPKPKAVSKPTEAVSTSTPVAPRAAFAQADPKAVSSSANANAIAAAAASDTLPSKVMPTVKGSDRGTRASTDSQGNGSYGVAMEDFTFSGNERFVD
jgi:hypothetical protein